VQTWENLLFMHWRMSPDLLRPLVPDFLEIDLYDDNAWISLVALTVQDASPAMGIPLPWLSFFHQVNIRTYVHRDGMAGIWLLSTDVDSQLMVAVARRFFHLPYFLASCHETHLSGTHRWEVIRRRAYPPAELSLACRQGDLLGETEPGRVEFFLLDRYAVYAAEGARLFRGRVHHKPWTIWGGTVKKYRSNMIEVLGIPAPEGEARVHFARSMPQVRVWPMEELKVSLREAR